MFNIKRHSIKEYISGYGAASLLIIIGFILTFQFIEPAPPKHISISAGSPEGAYYAFAQQYKAALALQGITLTIQPSSGSAENLQRLVNKKTDIAFVQGGAGEQNTRLLSLGSLYYEPVWLFYRQPLTVKRVNDLANKNVAIGPEGSGTRQLALILLQDNKLQTEDVNLVDSSGSDAAYQLLTGELDAAFFIGSLQSPIIHDLIENPTIQLMPFERALAYHRLHPFLSKIILPEGIIDLQKNIPSTSKTLIAPTANLLINPDFHPALSVLLLKALHKVHQKPGVFASASYFPNSSNLAAPISEVAERFYKKGPPFLMRYLPFGTAIMIDRFIILIIPFFALLIPLFKLMPPLYRWRISARIYKWYESLQKVDNKIHHQSLSDSQIKLLEQELNHIENEVHKVKTPLSYAEKIYQLLLHIELIRNKLNKT